MLPYTVYVHDNCRRLPDTHSPPEPDLSSLQHLV